MSDLDDLLRFSEVRSAVSCDFSGAFHDGFQEPDGEAVAAVIGLVALTLQQAGEHLGLGELQTVSIAGPVVGRLIVRRASVVLTATIEPAKALPVVLKALEGAR